MPPGPDTLTPREKQALRLLARGHDAKSAARDLGLSVHTVNDRLRDARRKLGVSSSREAARLLLAAESEAPEKSAPQEIGDAGPAPPAQSPTRPGRGGPLRPVLAAAGVFAVILSLSLLMLTPQAARTPAAPAAAAAAHPAETAARRFLELVDRGRWEESWRATGTEFRRLNTAAAWTRASERVRVPLGPVTGRAFLSHEAVPAPPAGVEVVKFRTGFANRTDVTETVALVEEGGEWRVVGVYVG